MMKNILLKSNIRLANYLAGIALCLLVIACKSSELRRQDSISRFGYLPNVDYTHENIKLYAEKWGIPEEDLFVIDRKGYSEEIWSYNEANRRLTHDLYQWHQIMSFNQDGEIISYLLNCRTKVENNDWQWNSRGTFDQFPPSDNSLKKFNKNLKLEQLAPFFLKLDGTKFSTITDSDSELTIVVFWTIYNGRQSENIIKTVRNYVAAHSDKKIRVVYLNHPSPYEIVAEMKAKKEEKLLKE